MSQILVQLPFVKQQKFVEYSDLEEYKSLENVLEYIVLNLFNLPQEVLENLYVQSKNKVINDVQELKNSDNITLNMRLPGGKGGFGTLMKAQARKRQKITNWDNSRDQHGRRIGHASMENRLVEYYRRKKEEDKKIRKAMEDFKRQQATVKQAEKVSLSQEFKDRIDKVESNMSRTILEGLKNSKKNQKEEQGQEEEEEEEEEKKEIESPQEQDKENIVIQEQNNNNNDNDNEDENLNKKRKLSDEVIKESEPEKEKIVVQEKEKKVWDNIELDSIKGKEELEKYEDEHIKNELQRLGLKCGGRNQDRVKRLWDIKLNPSLLFSPKYLAKK